MRKHKFANEEKQLTELKMAAILTDIFLLEAYVAEKAQIYNQDTLTVIKQPYYDSILLHHKVDSISFYSTLSFYQSHPEEFLTLLSYVDSNLYKIKPLDTTFVKPIVNVPDNIDKLSNFNEQEEAMRREYSKNHPALQKHKLKNAENSK